MTVSTISNLICSDVTPHILRLLACKPQQTIMHMEGSELKALRTEYNLGAVGMLTCGRRSPWPQGVYSPGGRQDKHTDDCRMSQGEMNYYLIIPIITYAKPEQPNPQSQGTVTRDYNSNEEA